MIPASDLFELMKNPSTTNDGAAAVTGSLSHQFLFSEGSTASPNRRTYNKRSSSRTKNDDEFLQSKGWNNVDSGFRIFYLLEAVTPLVWVHSLPHVRFQMDSITIRFKLTTIGTIHDYDSPFVIDFVQLSQKLIDTATDRLHTQTRNKEMVHNP
jgi:hypothetical protein